MPADYLPVFIFVVITAAAAFLIVGLSTLITKRKPSRDKLMPYECGVDPIGSARRRFSVNFFTIAMLFIIFDIEAVFLYPWAVIYRELGLFGLVEMAIFVGVLIVGLAYVWRRGALEWE